MKQQPSSSSNKKDEQTDQILFKNRIVFLNSDVSTESAQTLIKQLISLDLQEKKKITLLINSPGGEVSAGFAIYDTIRALRSPVQIFVTGLAASIATVILIAVPKSNRISFPHSRFLIHQPLISGMAQGPAVDLEITAKQILKIRELIAKLYEKETSQSLEKINRDIERDFWMTAAEACEYGLISKITHDKSPWSSLDKKSSSGD
jgi:ATP-dependent Clp protease protease subunit